MYYTYSCNDFFSGDDNVFDPGNTNLWDDKTTILYLHGALHLYRDRDGVTMKHVSEEDGDSLLDLIRKSNQIPIVISEGKWKDKRTAILGNDYLSFAHRTFAQNRIILVIFGHGLNEEYDKHIVEAVSRMQGWNRSGRSEFLVAVSVYPGTSLEIIDTKTRLLKALPTKTLYFYDATSHPLGSKSLQVAK